MSELSAWFPYEWRPYQKETYKAIANDYLKKKVTELMVVVATGGGKRSMAVQVSNVPIFHNKPILFLAHNEELINQAVNDFEKCHGFINVGVIKGPRFEIDKKVVVASPQTLTNRLDRIDPDYFGLVLIDECHRYLSKTWLKAVRHFNHTLRIGWTATPHRLDGLSLSNLFEKISYEYNLDQAIRDGYLCELDAIKVQTHVELKGIHKSMGDFNQKELEEKVDTPQRNNLIAVKYKEYALGRQFVAFCVTKNHAHNLADKFKLHGLNVAVLTSDTEDRNWIDKALREKKLDGVINVNILVEGWDYSEIGCVIDCSPTTSLTRYLQRIGRGTRLKSPEFVEKFGQNCIILDIIDNTGKHNVINTWELDRGKKASEKTFVTSEKREKLLEAEAARERKFKANIQKDTRINLLKLPKVEISGSPKMLDPATPAQIQFLKNLGIYDEEVEYTKALASEAISNNPAQAWQIRKLKAWGYDVSNGVSIGQFQRVKQKIEYDARFNVDPKDIDKAIKKFGT
jgi:superfamily II DNA or RNA helicase